MNNIKHKNYLVFSIGILLLSSVLLLHGSILKSSWRFEDGYLLNFSSQYLIPQFFANPEISRGLSYTNITPWLGVFFNLSAKVNIPFWSYLTLLLILYICAFLTYKLLSRTFTPWIAFFASCFFILSPGTAAIAGMLMTTHYALGLLFTLFCLILIQKDDNLSYICAVFFFGMACLSKEIFVPLPLILYFMLDGNWQEKLKKIQPFIVVLLLYILWRWYVLGSLFGTVAGISNLSLTWQQILFQLGNAIFGKGNLLWWLLILITLLGLSRPIARSSKKSLIIISVATLLIILPLWPVRGYGLESIFVRYVFLPSWGLAVLLAYLLHLSAQTAPRVSKIIAFILLGLLLPASLQYQSILNNAANPMEQVYKKLEQQYKSPTAILIPSFSGTEFAAHYSDLQIKNYPHTAAKLLKIEEDLFKLTPNQDVFIYYEKCNCFKNNYQLAIKLREQLALSMRLGQGHPLQGNIIFNLDKSKKSGEVIWHFLPDTEGSYEFRSDLSSINVPAQGKSRFGAAYALKPWRFYIRYRSPQGWSVQTPWFTMPVIDGQRTAWNEKASCRPPWC